MSVDVRVATPADEPGILDLCWQAYDEFPAGRSLSRPKVVSMVRNSLSGASGLIGVIDVESDIRAMIGLVVTSSWYSDDREISDWLAFVRPDCRHLRYFTPLLQFAKGQSDRIGIPLWLGYIGDARAEAKGHAYRRQLDAFGEFFRYVPQHQTEAA